MAEEQKEDFKLEEDMTPEELTKLTEDEDFIIGFKDEDYSDPDKVVRLEEAVKNTRTTIHQKRHYRAKLGDISKAKAPEVPKMPVKPKVEEDDSVSQNDILTFKVDHPEIPKEVIPNIVKYAKANGMTLEDASKDEVIVTLIKSKVTKNDVEDATPTPSSRTGGQFIAQKDWTNATPEEMDAARLNIMYPKR